MKRLFGLIVFSVVVGFVLLGCKALDYGVDETQKDGLDKAKIDLTVTLGDHVDAVLPYLYRPHLIVTRNEQKPYFFNGEDYNRIQFKPGSTNDKILTHVTKITDAWYSLKKAGFDRVDATLAITNDEYTNIAYFFKDDKYIKVKYSYGKYNDELLVGPTKISDGWPSLKKAGFNRVDAAFPYAIGPYRKEVGAYVFSGDSYVRIRLDKDRNDITLSGPTKISDGWHTLRDAGFSTVDAVLPVNGFPNEAFYPWHRVYVFLGDRYLYMKFTPGGGDALISGPTKISDGWPYL